MSARFWMFSMASAGAALMSGLGLGLYATTPPRVALGETDTTLAASQDVAAAYPTDLNGPADVKCSGCGPTLAQRQMTANMDSWSGYDDPAVQDYSTQASDSPEDLLPRQDDPPSPSVQPSQPRAERFAADETTAPQTVQFVPVRGAASESVPMSASAPY